MPLTLKTIGSAADDAGMVSKKLSAHPEEARPRLMVCCSMFRVDAELDYADAVCRRLADQGLYWQGDQEAVYYTFKAMGKLDSACDISRFHGLLDWDLTLRGMLWTGKGTRKPPAPCSSGARAD